MSDIVGTFRSYAHDKDNMPRMETEVVYVRVKHLLEAAARIEQLEAALEWIVGTALTEPEAMVAKARAALENRT